MTWEEYNATLGDKTIVAAPAASRQSNYFTTHVGGTPGEGRVLMRRSDYEDIESVGLRDLKVGLRGSNEWDAGSFATQGVVIKVIILGYKTYSTSKDPDNNGDDILEIYLTDYRWLYQLDRYTGAFNMMKRGAKDDTVDDAFAGSLSGGTTFYTWSTIIGLLNMVVAASGDDIDTISPRNFDTAGMRFTDIVDRVSSMLVRVAAWDWSNLISQDWELYDWGQVGTNNDAVLLDTTALLRDSLNKSVVKGVQQDPEEIHFWFSKTGEKQHADPYDTGRTYKVTHASGGSGLLADLNIHYGYFTAYYTNEDTTEPENEVDLQAVADYYGAKIYTMLGLNIEEKELAGIWPYKLDGWVQGIKWMFNQHGFKTMLRIHTGSAFDVPLQECNNCFLQGGGEEYVMPCIDGTQMVHSSIMPRGVFVGKINSVNGVSPNFTYVAEAVDDSNVKTDTPATGIEPANARVTSLAILEAQVGDPCLMFYDRLDILQIWLIEQIDHEDCGAATAQEDLLRDAEVQLALQEQSYRAVARASFR